MEGPALPAHNPPTGHPSRNFHPEAKITTDHLILLSNSNESRPIYLAKPLNFFLHLLTYYDVSLDAELEL